MTEPELLKNFSKELQITCKYIDVCHPEYLQDHHDREGEALISCDWSPEMTVEDITKELRSNFYLFADIPEHITTEEVCEAIDREFNSFYFDAIYSLLTINPSDLEEDEELPMLYAYLKWTT